VSNPPLPPGWWLASDGRWYPPELHPSVLPASAPTGAGPLQSPGHARRARVRSPWIWGGAITLALVLVGVLTVVGSGHGGAPPSAGPPPSRMAPDAHSTGQKAVAGSPGTASPGDHPSTVTAPTTEPAGAPAPVPPAAHTSAPTTQDSVGPASADVAVTQCVVDPTDARRAVVNGTVINHDLHSDDYTIIISIQQAGQSVGSAFVADDSVATGATAPWSALGTLSAGVGDDLSCQVTSVQRTSS